MIFLSLLFISRRKHCLVLKFGEGKDWRSEKQAEAEEAGYLLSGAVIGLVYFSELLEGKTGLLIYFCISCTVFCYISLENEVDCLS